MGRYMRNTNIIHKRTHHPQVRFALPEGDFICRQQKIVEYKFLGYRCFMRL